MTASIPPGFSDPTIHDVTMISAETTQHKDFCVIRFRFDQPGTTTVSAPKMQVFLRVACAEYARQIVSAINDVNAEVLAAEAAEEADEEDRDISPFDRWDMERRGVA